MTTQNELKLRYDSGTDWSKLKIMSQQKYFMDCFLPGAFQRDVMRKMEQGLDLVYELVLVA